MRRTHMTRLIGYRVLTSLTLAAALLATSTVEAGTKTTQHAELAPQVTISDLKTIVSSKSATIIDANSAETFTAGHIPGAVSFASNEGKLSSVLPKDKNAPIVAYCGGPRCSAWEAAAKEAKALGYTNLKHFKGGIKGWKDAGLATEQVAAK